MTNIIPTDKEGSVLLLPALGTIKPRQLRVGTMHPAEHSPRAYWEGCGFTLLEFTPEQEQIGGVPVLLPQNWAVHQAADSRIATLLDDRGRGRAFLSLPSRETPKCCMVPLPRFTILPHFAPASDIPEPGEGEERYSRWCYKVIDHSHCDPRPDGLQGRLLFSSSAFETENPDEQRSGHEAARHSCKAWLNTRWPDWENPFAYWAAEEKQETSGGEIR